MTGAKYHPREVHFHNQRIKEALYTDFGANRETPKICCWKVTKSYNACNLWQRQNTTPERYIFLISASRRPYIPILGQIERPKKSAAEGYNACNLWLGQNTSTERYIFVISASRRLYIPILGQIKRPQKSATGKLQKITTLVTCDRGKIPSQRGTFS